MRQKVLAAAHPSRTIDKRDIHIRGTVFAPQSVGDSSRGSLKNGLNTPDEVVCTTTGPHRITGFRQNKFHVLGEKSGRFGLTWVYISRPFTSTPLENSAARDSACWVSTRAFQRPALLDDRTIAIETTSVSFSSSEMSIDQLDECQRFWDNIPNTLLVPSSDSSAMEYHTLSQMRYVPFFQYVYHPGASVSIPPRRERRAMALPRPLQRLDTPVPGGWISTFGPGHPMPVPLPTIISSPRVDPPNVIQNSVNIASARIPRAKYEIEQEKAHKASRKENKLNFTWTDVWSLDGDRGNDIGQDGDDSALGGHEADEVSSRADLRSS
ncbi:hypothetical protein FRB94_007957 [Tulasnella sp. JGI-2019a]|nr:hypothetical protein FRB93_005019 [Tulasnella sp. JGI-2019a]KAG8996969.1 hypothetical protein FRB94_007957 [Tulasnella sp. JGI-2019a]